MLGNQLCTLLIGFLEAEAVTLVIACETFVTPCRNLVHRYDAWLFEGFTCIFLHLLIVLPMEGRFTKSEIAGCGTLLRQIFLFQFQGLQVTLLSQSHVARLFTNGAEGKGGEIQSHVTVVLLGMMVNVVCQLHTLHTIDIFEHIGSLVTACPIIGFLVVRELGGFLQVLHSLEKSVSLSRTVTVVHLSGHLLESRRKFLLSGSTYRSHHQKQERQGYITCCFLHHLQFRYAKVNIFFRLPSIYVTNYATLT